jgi:CubicO group peptidase (beta-lactamase class C family)
MNTKSRVVLALSAGCLFFLTYRNFFPAFRAASTTDTTIEMDTLANGDAYGMDRFMDETVADEEWLPEVEVGSKATGPKAEHLLDTISLADWEYYRNMGAVLQNPGQLLPLHLSYEVQLIRYTPTIFPVFANTLSEILPFREYTWATELPACELDCNQQQLALVLLNEESAAALAHQQTAVVSFGADRPTVLVYFGARVPEYLLSQPFPLLHLPDQRASAQAMAVQMLFGSQDVQYTNEGTVLASRLGHAPPESVGIDRKKLARIDDYVERAIRRKAIPGCQVLVAKSGRIVYDKTFGFFTYDKEQAVDHQSVYDLASITKAAATTLSVMDLYDKGKVDLSERLREYLPDYSRTGLKYFRIRHLLSHHTGLQANLPIAHWLRQDDLFQDTPNEQYPIAVSNDFYLKEGVSDQLLEELKKVRTSRRQFYRYSDVNFILLQQVIEQVSNSTLDRYASQKFYEPLGLRRLQYRPGNALPTSEIVPTERDNRWRRQLVRGEVHDESAVLLGGVAGHAGLFGNARDLAAIFQMLLNGGTYGNRQFLQEATVAEFTKRNGYNYRAFGFDRLAGHSKSLQHYGASKNTFGHTGFTGTCVWADPDEDLVFIFLSNRIYPDKKNDKLLKMGLRERIHKIIYQSLDTFQREV